MERRELTIAHAEWLEAARKIPCEVAAAAGVVSDGKHLAFEYRQNGTVSFLKVRREVVEHGERTKTFFIQPKGVELCLWNEDCLSAPSSPDAPLIITEGEFDALSFMTAGVPDVVSVPNGAAGRPGQGAIVPSEDKQFAYLWDGHALKAGLKRYGRIILATDDDEPGRILREELAIRLGRTRCWWVRYPEGCKDANEVLDRHGADALSDMIAAAKPLVPNKLVAFDEIPQQANRTAYSSGWRGLDQHLKLVMPSLVVITGVPNAGKSQWALALGANLAHTHGLKGAILQFEDSVERNREDLIRYYRGKVDGATRSEAIDWMGRMFRTLSPSEDVDEDADFTLAWLKAAIEEAATRHAAKWVLVDPWNELEHMWGINETETGYTNKALKDLKRLARRYQIALIVVTHPSKSGGQVKPLEDMTLYDVAGSAAWRNKADHGVIVYRASKDDPVTHIKVDKSKDFALMGTPGVVRMKYRATLGTYEWVGSGS
jgi:twinkle protein